MSTVTLDTFDPLVAEQSLLHHPFYVRWSKGELTLPELQVYAKEYYHVAKSVPRMVERIRVRALERQPDLVPLIEENLREETEHVELWERFAKSLGVSEEQLEVHEPHATVRAAIAELSAIGEQGFDEGISAMYAFELELPQIAHTKKEGLEKFYDLTSEDAHCYFDAHLGEEAHLRVWRAVPVQAERGEAAVRASTAAQNRVLDGVCEAAGISMHC